MYEKDEHVAVESAWSNATLKSDVVHPCYKVTGSNKFCTDRRYRRGSPSEPTKVNKTINRTNVRVGARRVLPRILFPFLATHFSFLLISDICKPKQL